MSNQSQNAKDIFDAFQTRRSLLRRGGALAAVATLPTALAGCLQVAENAFVDTPQGRVILVEPGRNCWNGRCVTWDATAGTLSAPGRDPVPVPDGVDLSDGRVTEAEFDLLVQAARAGAIQSGGGGDGGSGGGGGGGGPGSE